MDELSCERVRMMARSIRKVNELHRERLSGALGVAVGALSLVVVLGASSCGGLEQPPASPTAPASPSPAGRSAEQHESEARVPSVEPSPLPKAASPAPTEVPASAAPIASPTSTPQLPDLVGVLQGRAAAAGTPDPTPAPAQTPAQPGSVPSALPAAPPSPAVPPPGGAQRTVASWLQKAADFRLDQSRDVQVRAGEGVALAARDGGFARDGEYLSAVREAEFLFDDVVLSWNADAPEGTSLRFEVRVRGEAEWSGWYAMGEWTHQGGRSVSGQSDSRGRVDIDTLKLSHPATALQYRVKMATTSAASTPLLRQVSLVYADLRRGLVGPSIERPAGAVRDLDVPKHSQLEQDPSVALKICSPTSLAMVLQYWGAGKSVPEVVAGVRDRTTGIFGNWPLNTAYAGANGFEARVERFYSMEQLEQEIATGRPVVISIAFAPGELDGSPTRSTDGHLIVVRGFTAEGDVIVNDPIAPNSKSVRLVYKREQLRRIWLRSGGIAYLISPRG